MDEENFIEIKYRELVEIGLSDEYIGLYTSEKNERLRDVFSSLHNQFILLFKTMNERLPTKDEGAHFWAEPSRQLIKIIDITFELYNSLKGSNFSFTINEYYHDLFIRCKEFLSESGGSLLPPHMEKIVLYYTLPIFIVSDTITIPGINSSRMCELMNIGEGSYAIVFRYKDPFYNRYYAIKRAKSDLSEKELERFKNEYEEMKMLSSPYIVEVYRYDEHKKEYVMEYIDETLSSYISKNNTTLTKSQRKRIVKQILSGFDYIHKQGRLHRDISHKNIMVKKYEDVAVIKISDFGLVKIPDSTLTSIDTDFKGLFNDPALRIEGFSNYNILHETYALTRIVYFVMTGKTNTDNISDNALRDFVLKGLNSDMSKRFKNVTEMMSLFQTIN